MLKDSESNEGIKAFIFDDTTIEKTGYKIEGSSRVWNHVVNRTVLGYQLLVMGYTMESSLFLLIFHFIEKKEKIKKHLMA